MVDTKITGASFGQQLKALMWRNFVLKTRKKKQTIQVRVAIKYLFYRIYSGEYLLLSSVVLLNHKLKIMPIGMFLNHG